MMISSARPAFASLSRVELFMVVVTVGAIPVVVWSLSNLGAMTWNGDTRVIAVLTGALVIGELWPIEIQREGRHSNEITVSSTFALALVFIAPLGAVIVAQAVPLVIDDVRRRKHWLRVVFNVSQYVLTFAVSRLVFATLSGQSFLHPAPFTSGDVPASFAAVLAFYVSNHVLVAAAVALWSGEPVKHSLTADLQFDLVTTGLLVALAPAVVGVIGFSIVLMPTLLLPILAVRNTARIVVKSRSDALRDALTGLPNRARLMLELGRVLPEARRRGSGLAVLFLDLNNFREVNDTLGHTAGDQLICAVAERLTATTEDAIMVARLGGDEFAVLRSVSRLDSVSVSRQAVIELADRIQTAFTEAVPVAGVKLEIRASVGIALAPDHTDNAEDLLVKADIAMYQAKRNGGGWSLYDPHQDDNTPERLLLLTQMRDGLEKGEFVVHYQPKCDASNGRVIGTEALARWDHPTRGLLGPNEFVPLAETTDLINDLTLVVLDAAIAQTARWVRSGRWIGVAVNLSVRHLVDAQLPEQVSSLLRRHQLPAQLLTLEVTESIMMSDPARVSAVLAAMRGLGVKISIDDYGTGYSSLAYLKSLAVDELKIDRSFIGGLTRDEDGHIIVKSTVELGHNLGLHIVAEGVEDIETWHLLRELGCDVIQGYLISRPRPASEFGSWLGSWDTRLAEHTAVSVVATSGGV